MPRYFNTPHNLCLPAPLFQLLLLVCLSTAFSGCSFIIPHGIKDLNTLPQNATSYLSPDSAQTPLLSASEHKAQATYYKQRFFKPWHLAQPSLTSSNAFWGVSVYGKKQGYAENLQPYSLAAWDKLVAMQQIPAYPSLHRKAITTQNTSLRVFPTNKPFFLDPTKAGEGFPFDYFQNSALWIGTPLLITHFSADGAWVFAESGYAYGWLRANTIGWISDEQAKQYESLPLVSCVSEHAFLFAPSPKGSGTHAATPANYLAEAKLGSLFPQTHKNSLLIPQRTVSGNTYLKPALFSPRHFLPFPQMPTPKTIAAVANNMMGQPYGWGGLFENRDCSATMRDILTPFGIWLPRNSRSQAKYGGANMNLKDLTAAAKRRTIRDHAIPFFTLINFKGHVGLYLGLSEKGMFKQQEPILLHNAWGVRTLRRGKQGRAIIGKFAVTTLRAGEERSDVEKDTLYKKMTGITVLPPLAND